MALERMSLASALRVHVRNGRSILFKARRALNSILFMNDRVCDWMRIWSALDWYCGSSVTCGVDQKANIDGWELGSSRLWPSMACCWRPLCSGFQVRWHHLGHSLTSELSKSSLWERCATAWVWMIQMVLLIRNLPDGKLKCKSKVQSKLWAKQWLW